MCPYGFCPTQACASQTRDDNPNTHLPYKPDPSFDISVPFCPVKDYDSIEDLYDDLANIGEHCGTQYVIQMAERLLERINTRFSKIMKASYDDYFEIYAEYVSKQAPAVLSEFLKKQSDRYFTCEIMEELFCCPGCQFKGYDCRYCQYGKDVCDAGSPWGNGELPSKFEKKREPCPPQYQERGNGDNDRHSIYWTLHGDKEEDFYNDVEVATGAKKEFIEFIDKFNVMTPPTGCIGLVGSTMSEKCLAQNHWFNVPVVRGFSKDDVTNPKKAIEEALVNMAAMRIQLMASRWEILAGTYAGEADDFDLIDAIILPIFMVEESLKSMEEVVKMAKEIKAAQAKEFILHMLSTVFFVIGAVGGALASAGLASLGRVLVLIGEAGGTALGIEGVVSDPTTAPVLIFGLIMSGRGIRDVSNVARAARIRRAMPTWEVEKFSPEIAKKMNFVDDALNNRNVNRVCKGIWA
ncbi:hypothetical protein QQX98_008040 [Neonectria punicea]|uniref:Uncharacterized protein n=1 Tax=Neonectria punicea TaxID=979145 RepID=A0ABR1GWH1_9HYPO